MAKNSITQASALFSILFLFVFTSKSSAQNLAGIVNRYAPATAFDTCSGRLSIGGAGVFEAGQAVLIYQAQGAAITTTNNSSFGNVSAINSAGLFEVNEIVATGSGFLRLKYRLENAYDFSTGNVQVVASPKISSATVSDTLFPKKWDGSSGGIVFLKGQKIALQKPIDASGAGFRGGVSNSAGGNDCYFLIAQNAFSYDSNNWRGSLKGEGIADFSGGKEAGKGAQANGGGGGNDHNAGGGGGSNASKGGNGGKNDEPDNFNCNGDHPGVGGKALVFTGQQRLFLGGGGGSGHANNSSGGDGGAGGGIVVIVADSLTGAASIFSDGQKGESSQGDGAGGGGAGGSVFLFIKKNLANLTVRANGGAGGSANNSNEARCFGPGGGGASGRVVANFAATSTLVGGVPGVVLNSTDGCNGSSNGAQQGEANAFELLPPLATVPGSLHQAGPPMIMAQPKSLLICKGEPIVFTTAAMGSDLVYDWELKGQSGWASINASNLSFSGQKSPILTVSQTAFPVGGPYEFRCRIRSANNCGHPVETTNAAQLEIYEPPSVNFTSAAMSNLTVVFQSFSQNLTGQLWDFGNGSTSSQPNPSHQFSMPGLFSVTLTGWNPCDTVSITKIISTEAAPVAFFEVADSIFGCGNAVPVLFENQTDIVGGSYEWKFPGGQPATSTLENPTITYSSAGIKIANLIAENGAGKDTFQRTFKVFFTAAPIALFQVMNITGYQVALQNLSQHGDSYQWDFGDGATFVGFQPPVHTFPAGGPRIVTLVVQNACGAAVYQLFLDIAYTATEAILAEKWGFSVAPNPTDGLFRVELKAASESPQGESAAPFSAQIFDARGRLLFEKNEIEKAVDIDLRDRPAGIFFLKIKSRDGQLVRRVVKN